MKILVTSKAGRNQTRKTVSSEWLRIGRNTSCEIHLPDPRVPLEQGMIVYRDGLVYMEGEAGSQVITRRSVRSERMHYGEPLEVGPYRIEMTPPPPGYDAALKVELVHPLEAMPALAARSSELTLGSLGLTKRWAAWLWALAVLILFLVVPAGRVLDLPWRQAAQTAAFGDRFWNPGPVMLAHQPVEPKCGACHQVAFQHVKDRACLECHKNIGHHVGPEMKPAALFEGARCATCHREHKGIKTTHRDDDRFCVSCHRDLSAHAKETTDAKVSDFARDHPAFRLTLGDDSGGHRVRQGEGAMLEQAHLTFPHAAHLDAKGVRSPLKGRVRLDCASCHQPDASKRGFEPVSMARHCQECHTLQFEPAVTTREVPHGKVADALTVIEEFYANLALKGTPDSFQKAFGVAGEGLLRRAGEPTTAQRQGALSLAGRKARQVGRDLVEVRVCKTCHEVAPAPTAAPSPDWKIAPVRQNMSWMPAARFDHQAHRQSKCATCHDVATSKKSSDVSMPTIKACRECHGGSKPAAGKITSNCMLCHGFHDARHPWDPSQPRPVTRVAGHADAK
jgi:predicted CXXCH cytochrome family protein